MKNILFTLLIIITLQLKVIAQSNDCKCRLLYRYYDSTTNSYPKGLIMYEYPNDTLLIAQSGGTLNFKTTELHFDGFKNFSNSKDSIIVKNGEFYYQFLGKQYLFRSRLLFDEKQRTVKYHLAKNSIDTTKILVVKTVLIPLAVEEINGVKYFKYKTYGARIALSSKDITIPKLNNIKESVKSDAKGKFVIDEHSYSTDYFVPGKGDLISHSGLFKNYLGKYIETVGCEQFIKDQFKSWY